jgi:DNA-directed RNA polymerase specialized sigma24 family protein
VVSDPFATLDVARCEALADRAAGGDASAWSALAERLWPALHAFVRTSRSLGALRRSEDDVQDVATKLLERLGGREGRSLQLHRAWRARHPDKTFADWLRIAAANVARDHVRAKRGGRPAADGLPSVKRLLNEFASSPALESLGARPPITAAQTARQLLDFARTHLPKPQLAALEAWLEGAGFPDIQRDLGLRTPDEASKLVRAATAVLRRRFVGDD